MNEEIWKPVLDTDGWYEVSNLGRVRSWIKRKGRSKMPGRIRLDSPLILRQTKNKRGHQTVGIAPQGHRGQPMAVHRLVLDAFSGPCPKDMETRHLNGNVVDNRRDNLKWGTRKEKTNDRRINGTLLLFKGEVSTHSVLNDNLVCALRRMARKGCTISSLSKEFNINTLTMRNAINGNKWSHLNDIEKPVRPKKRRTGNPTK